MSPAPVGRGQGGALAYGVAREPDGVPRRVLPRWARGGRSRGPAHRRPGPPLPVGRAAPPGGRRAQRGACHPDGTVKLTKTATSGREAVLELRGAGDVVGELGAIDGQSRSASTVALGEVEALVLPADGFNALLASGAHSPTSS